MTRALLGRTLGHYWPSKSAGAASVPPPPAGCDGPDCARSRSPAHGRPGPAHPASTHRAAGVDRGQGAVGLPDQPAGRVLADQGDQLATLGLVEPAWPTRAGSVTEPVDTVGVEAVQPLPHGLGVTAQPGGDLAGPLAVPLRTTIRARRIQSAGAWRLAASRRRVRCSSGSAGGRACSNGGMGSGLRMVPSQGGREQTEHSTTYRI